ncbi:MAG: type II toxin-antitoxin system death-on-curing family toxin [Herpetosiphonaceae bacterium]|nr:type II toxin-antitoxin system death-on-curing family toxin [Herpetosiphonaceae bacterium]
MINYLSEFDVRRVRRELAQATGERFDLLNHDGLLSALAAPKQTMFGEELHPTLIDKAATLFFLLIKNHPFYDGNKRIALIALRTFLAQNGWVLRAPDEEALPFAKRIAATANDTTAIYSWLQHVVEEQPSTRR